MSDPRLTIVTPSYNQAAYLENTILSVLEQGYSNLEYILMDGGSTDGSRAIIEKYSKYLTYWQSQPDGGQVAAINAGFERATGEIWAFLNSDDFLLQGAVRHVIELYDQCPQAAAWVGGGYGIAPDGYILQACLPRQLSRDDLADWTNNWFYQPACFFSAQWARAAGRIDNRYENAFDFDLWMRLAGLGELVPTSQVLAAATVHADAKTQKYMARMYEEVQAIQQNYGYAVFAQATQDFIDQARQEKPASAAARLLYLTHRQRQNKPVRYVRFPGGRDRE